MSDCPIDPFGAASLQNPYPFFSWLRANAPVYRVPETGHYVVATYDAVKEVCKSPEAFSSKMSRILQRDAQGGVNLVKIDNQSPESGMVLGAEDGDYHRKHRTILSRCFTPQVRKLEPLIRETARQSISDLQPSCDLMEDFAKLIPRQVILELLGIPIKDATFIDDATHAAITLVGGVNTDEQLIEDAPKLVALQEYLVGHLNNDKAGSPVMVSLREAIATTELARGEVLGILFQLVIGGIETTVSVLGSMLDILSTDAQLCTTLRDDPTLIPAFVEEVLRFESPAQGNYRICTQDYELAGVAIPAGASVTLLWGSANRDEAVFPGADQLVLNRDNIKSHLAFGQGIHFCLGANLARMESVIAIEEWLMSSCDVSTGSAKHYHESLFVRCLQQLPATVVNRGQTTV
jgi:cytochrome P450